MIAVRLHAALESGEAWAEAKSFMFENTCRWASGDEGSRVVQGVLLPRDFAEFVDRFEGRLATTFGISGHLAEL